MIGKRIWITGASGNIGNVLVKVLSGKTDKVFSTDTELDVTDTEKIIRFAVINRPDIIINCACMSDIEKCESNRVDAYKVNSLGARNLSLASRQTGAVMVQISTDDVFSGDNERVLNEFDRAEPHSVYGKSKLAGEKFVRELNPTHIIIRSAWIYGYGKDDFVSSVLEAARKGSVIDAAVNQVSSPTGVYDLAKFIAKVVQSDEYGIFHAVCRGKCSRFDFAAKILELGGFKANLLKPALYGVNGRESMRPRYTALENLMMEMTGVYRMPDWETALEKYMKERGETVGGR